MARLYSYIQQKAIPKRVAFVTLNEKYNGFRSAIAE